MCLIYLLVMEYRENLEFDSNMRKAASAMWRSYYKVLKVNLTCDSYEIVKVLEEETVGDMGYAPSSISKWLSKFADAGRVYEADVEIFRKGVSLDNLQKYFKLGNERYWLRYRRRTRDSVRWVFLEMVRSDEYTDDEQVVWLYVRDVHDSYTQDLEDLRELELNCKLDTLTGLNNFFSYQQLCRKYSKKNVCVGVIFADLNGLKITNDRFGHSAGNELLRDFSRSLLYQFSSENVYRISGDEFLVILFGLNEAVFKAIAEQYILTVKADRVPKACVGYAWSDSPQFIEDVTKRAETSMYVEKDAFYEDHPEYKRGVAAEMYRRETEAIIMNLAKSYDVMATIDLENDTYWILKTFETSSQIVKRPSYSEFRTSFVERIKPEYREVLLHAGSIENLKKVLKETPSLTCEYQLIDGTWLRISFRLLEMREGNVVKAIFFIERIDPDYVEKLRMNAMLNFEHSIIEGISAAYSMISIIDVTKKIFMLYKNYALSEDVASAINALNFDNARRWFCQTYVVEGDQKAFLQATQLEVLQKELADKNEYSVQFGTVPEFHHTQNVGKSEFIFYRLHSDAEKIVFVTRRLA